MICFPGAKIEAVTERVETIIGPGKGGSVLVHVGTNNVERKGTTVIIRKYRQLFRTIKQTRVEHTYNYLKDFTSNEKQESGISTLLEDGNKHASLAAM